jgi:hypothetical protein
MGTKTTAAIKEITEGEEEQEECEAKMAGEATTFQHLILIMEEEGTKMDSLIIEVEIKITKINNNNNNIKTSWAEASSNKINLRIKTRSNKTIKHKCADILNSVSIYIIFIINKIIEFILITKESFFIDMKLIINFFLNFRRKL